MKILTTAYCPEEAVAKYRDRYEIIMPSTPNAKFTDEELVKLLPEVDGVFVMAGRPFRKELIDISANVKVIANHGVGYDNIDWKYCTEKKIPVINTPTTVTESTAELTMSIMLDTVRDITYLCNKLRSDRTFDADLFFTRSDNLEGKTLGVCGFGRIGKSVCKKAQAFGMKVVFYDPFVAAEAGADFGAEKRELEELLAESDIVTVHVPYIPENHHIINKARLAMMKPGSYLINTARGPLVCEEALLEAIEIGHIKGAALDVFEFEPKISDRMAADDRIVITPHVGTQAYATRVRMAHEALDGLTAVLEGKKPLNVANKEVFK